MYPSTSFQRSHVLHVHVFIVSPALHIDMQFTSDVIIKFQSYVFKPIPKTSLREAMYTLYILPRSHVHLVHLFQEPCTQVHFSEELCTQVHPPKSYACFHHLTYVTHKHAVYMRCCHTNFSHRFSNLFHAYNEFPVIN